MFETPGYRRCRDCGMVKPHADYYREAKARDGIRPECKECMNARRRATYPARRDAEIARVRAWQQANRERYAARQRAYRESGKKKVSSRKSHLKRTFGITPEHYDGLLAAQQGTCAICATPAKDPTSLHVDHDHRTGAVRGLLCFDCNSALGKFRDDLDLLESAAAYLVEHQTRHIRARLFALVS